MSQPKPHKAVSWADAPKQNSSAPNKKNKKTKQPKSKRSTVPVAYKRQIRPRMINFNDVFTVRFTEDFPVIQQEVGYDYMLPSTPTKWINHRASAIGQIYTAYRPISVRYEWVPSCPTTTSGTVTLGAILDGARAGSSSTTKADLQQTLAATNGSVTTQVWQSASRNLRLGTSLRSNLYPNFNVDEDEISFWIMVVSQASVTAGTQIGYLRIHCVYAFHNPITQPVKNIGGDSEFTITHTENESNMSAPLPVGTVLPVGSSVTITPWRAVTNTNGSIVAQPLQSIKATVKSIAGSLITYAVSSALATQTFRGSYVGRDDINF